MSVQENTRAESADLPITLYLNQRATFDLVAASEGGLSHFSTVQTTSSGKQSSEMSGEAQVGIGNAFGLFGLKLEAAALEERNRVRARALSRRKSTPRHLSSLVSVWICGTGH